MSTIRTIIVEDEKSGMQNLVGKLGRSCPDVEIIAQCRTGEEAIAAIHELKPQLVFLDIQLGTLSGFDVLERLPHIQFEVIITTSYDKYAIKGIKANALDYLLKPVTDQELIAAVDKARQKLRPKQEETPSAIRRIAVPISDGIKFLEVADIMYCKAFDNFTYIHLSDEGSRPLLITRTLKDIHGKLPPDRFFRIHRGSVIHRDYLDAFSRADGGYAVMKDGTRLPVANPRRNDFLAWLMEE